MKRKEYERTTLKDCKNKCIVWNLKGSSEGLLELKTHKWYKSAQQLSKQINSNNLIAPTKIILYMIIKNVTVIN